MDRQEKLIIKKDSWRTAGTRWVEDASETHEIIWGMMRVGKRRMAIFKMSGGLWFISASSRWQLRGLCPRFLNLPWHEQWRENAIQLNVTCSPCIICLILFNHLLFDDVLEYCYSLDQRVHLPSRDVSMMLIEAVTWTSKNIEPLLKIKFDRDEKFRLPRKALHLLSSFYLIKFVLSKVRDQVIIADYSDTQT
jgi:hypothetical protein